MSHSKVYLPHDHYNKKIHDWTKTMELDRWYSIENMKMPKEEFIQAVTYLIACNEPLLFNNQMTALKRHEPDDFTQWKS